MSTVDIVIPCYNYGHYLGSCVDSVLSQTDVNVRVLIIDDASTDNSADIGQRIAAADRRVEFRRHETNLGHITTYNEGLIDWSVADYVVLLSADDALVPGSLNRAAQIMNSDETVGMVYGRPLFFEHDVQVPTTNGHRSGYTIYSGADWVEKRCKAGYNVISSPEVVVRGRIQRSVGGYRNHLPHAGDLEMWLRIAAVSNIGYVHGVPQACYRVHPRSMLRTKYKSNLLDLAQRKAAFDAFFEEHRHFPDVDRLQSLANRALAREALWDACRAYDHNRVQEAGAMELLEFALNTYSGAAILSEHSALERRRRLGALVCNRTQIFVGTAIMRRIQRWWLKHRWKRYGI